MVSIKAKNRKFAWKWAKTYAGSSSCVWRLELMKVSIKVAENKNLPLPPFAKVTVTARHRIRALAGLVGGILASAVYLLRHRFGANQEKLPRNVKPLIAVHAEWSTRTRHLVAAADAADLPIESVILLGRVKCNLRDVASIWKRNCPGSKVASLNHIHPISPRACFGVARELHIFIRQGIRAFEVVSLDVPLKELVAISFRVILGEVSAKWWEKMNVAAEVVFGMTGTADTTLLERAIQRNSGKTVHMVHGQATGPNFVGFSDVAFFRSLYDATAYNESGCYGRCSVQSLQKPSVQRGGFGTFLLTNLAHPMNAGFQAHPLKDELLLLVETAEAARHRGKECFPLFWKPHPVIAKLSVEQQATLRSEAVRLGFIELASDTNILDMARKSRWVLSSPSTVSLDLLKDGILTLILDPQNTVLDTAIRNLPQVPTDRMQICEFLGSLDDCDRYTLSFDQAFSEIGPAESINLKKSL